MELNKQQWDSTVKQNFSEDGIPNFYAHLSVDQFPKII
jgi:hypothetical protein